MDGLVLKVECSRWMGQTRRMLEQSALPLVGGAHRDSASRTLSSSASPLLLIPMHQPARARAHPRRAVAHLPAEESLRLQYGHVRPCVAQDGTARHSCVRSVAAAHPALIARAQSTSSRCISCVCTPSDLRSRRSASQAGYTRFARSSRERRIQSSSMPTSHASSRREKVSERAWS